MNAAQSSQVWFVFFRDSFWDPSLALSMCVCLWLQFSLCRLSFSICVTNFFCSFCLMPFDCLPLIFEFIQQFWPRFFPVDVVELLCWLYWALLIHCIDKLNLYVWNVKFLTVCACGSFAFGFVLCYFTFFFWNLIQILGRERKIDKYFASHRVLNVMCSFVWKQKR